MDAQTVQSLDHLVKTADVLRAKMIEGPSQGSVVELEIIAEQV